MREVLTRPDCTQALMMASYQAFGTKITAAIQLPWLLPAKFEPASSCSGFGPRSVIIKSMQQPLCQKVAAVFPEVTFNDNRLQLRFNHGFGFDVSADSIWVSCYQDELYPLVQQRLITAGVAALFCFHQYLQLHGSVVDYRGKRIIVVGERGAGKTSFICDALELGARLIADDITLIRPDYRVVPAFPAIRLSKDRPAPPGFKLVGEVPGAPKKQYWQTSDFLPADIRPADFILHLVANNDQADWQLKVPNNLERIQSLTKNLYRPKVQQCHPDYRWQMQNLMDYALQIPLFKVLRPAKSTATYQSGLSMLPEELFQ